MNKLLNEEINRISEIMGITPIVISEQSKPITNVLNKLRAELVGKFSNLGDDAKLLLTSLRNNEDVVINLEKYLKGEGSQYLAKFANDIYESLGKKLGNVEQNIVNIVKRDGDYGKYIDDQMDIFKREIDEIPDVVWDKIGSDLKSKASQVRSNVDPKDIFKNLPSGAGKKVSSEIIRYFDDFQQDWMYLEEYITNMSNKKSNFLNEIPEEKMDSLFREFKSRLKSGETILSLESDFDIWLAQELKKNKDNSKIVKFLNSFGGYAKKVFNTIKSSPKKFIEYLGSNEGKKFKKGLIWILGLSSAIYVIRKLYDLGITGLVEKGVETAKGIKPAIDRGSISGVLKQKSGYADLDDKIKEYIVNQLYAESKNPDGLRAENLERVEKFDPESDISARLYFKNSDGSEPIWNVLKKDVEKGTRINTKESAYLKIPGWDTLPKDGKDFIISQMEHPDTDFPVSDIKKVTVNTNRDKMTLEIANKTFKFSKLPSGWKLD